jgi:hypothetical protein
MTQKKTYNIQNMAKVLNQENVFLSQCNMALLYNANLFWLSELLSLCISAFTCLACLIFTALKDNIFWYLLCLITNNLFHIYSTL